MIESIYWKKDLIEFSKSLCNQKPIKRWSEKAQVNFEKEIILKFFLVRKLMESNTISNSLRKELFEITAYPKINKSVTPWNQYYFDEHFDLAKPQKVKKDIKFICNQLIHSLIVFAFVEEKKWSYIMTCSDFEYSNFIYKVEIKEVAEIFKKIGENYPNSMKYNFNNKTGKYETELE